MCALRVLLTGGIASHNIIFADLLSLAHCKVCCSLTWIFHFILADCGPTRQALSVTFTSFRFRLKLRVVSRSLTHQSTLTLFHAFVTSRIDSCSSLLAELPLGTLAQFSIQLPVLFEYCPSFLLALPACVMYYIGCLPLSGYTIVLRRWSPGLSFAVPPLIFVISAAQCRFKQRVGCSVLLRWVSSWSLGHV